MFSSIRTRRPISEFSTLELQLQKESYRIPSMVAIIGIKQLLADLSKEGVFVRRIKNFEQSPCAAAFPGSIYLTTGMPITEEALPSCGEHISVAWDFWRTEVVQHVLESVVV